MSKKTEMCAAKRVPMLLALEHPTSRLAGGRSIRQVGQFLVAQKSRF